MWNKKSPRDCGGDFLWRCRGDNVIKCLTVVMSLRRVRQSDVAIQKKTKNIFTDNRL